VLCRVEKLVIKTEWTVRDVTPLRTGLWRSVIYGLHLYSLTYTAVPFSVIKNSFEFPYFKISSSYPLCQYRVLVKWVQNFEFQFNSPFCSENDCMPVLGIMCNMCSLRCEVQFGGNLQNFGVTTGRQRRGRYHRNIR
jgi:hypothetical protein